MRRWFLSTIYVNLFISSPIGKVDKFLLNKYIDLDLFDTLDGTVAI